MSCDGNVTENNPNTQAVTEQKPLTEEQRTETGNNVNEGKVSESGTQVYDTEAMQRGGRNDYGRKLNQLKSERDGNAAVEEPQPVGKGVFGNIYDQFRGKAKEAINFLLGKREGEAVGALSHKDVGDIDIVWGEEGTGSSDGYGLAKIAKYHPEVLNDLQGILDDTHVVTASDNRIILESDTHKAAIRLEWDGQKKKWLLTAYEKKESSVPDNTTDTAKTLLGRGNDTATPQNTASDSKVTENNPNTQAATEQKPLTEEQRLVNDALRDRLEKSGIKVSTATDEEAQFISNSVDKRIERQYVSNQILDLFNQAKEGNLKGKSVQVGVLTSDGKKVLENLSGIKMKDNIDFRLNPSDLIHIFNEHFGTNEKDPANNVPLTEYDIKRIVDVISFPTDIVYGIDKQGRNLFYFLRQENDGTYNLLEVYADRKGNLIAKTFYKSKKGVTQRVMDIQSLLSTSKTYSGTTLSDAKIPQLFDTAKPSVVEAQMVYHGSGAKFDKFDHSFMGSGEGSQAYGWGTYVSESDGVAKSYAERVGSKREVPIKLNGKSVDLWDLLEEESFATRVISALKDAEYSNNDRYNANEAFHDQLKYTIEEYREHARKFIEKNGESTYAEEYLDAADWLEKNFDNLSIDRIKPVERTLYTVEIPDDNGRNYLDWNGRVDKTTRTSIAERLAKAVKESDKDVSYTEDTYNALRKDIENAIVEEDVTGESLYGTVSLYLGTDKAASDFLSECGFTGVKVPVNNYHGGNSHGKMNYVIFNESDAKILSSRELLRRSDGKVYGWADENGGIHLTEDGLNPNTQIHEYTHLWSRALRKNHPKVWQSIVDLCKSNKMLWDDVANDPAYAHLNGDENLITSEIVSRYSGREGERRLNGIARRMYEEAQAVIREIKCGGKQKEIALETATWSEEDLRAKKAADISSADGAKLINKFDLQKYNE